MKRLTYQFSSTYLLWQLFYFFFPHSLPAKMYHKGIYNLSNRANNKCDCNLYADYYLSASGFMTTDINAVYLTDLKNFRVYIGRYDEANEKIDIQCNGDLIQTIKTSTENINTLWTKPVIIEKKGFNIKELKKKGDFD